MCLEPKHRTGQDSWKRRSERGQALEPNRARRDELVRALRKARCRRVVGRSELRSRS